MFAREKPSPRRPLPLVLAALALVAGCRSGAPRIVASGSSTVFPLTEAVAEEFGRLHPAVHVSVGVAGTRGGFKQLCAGALDICDASRPIRPEEARTCAARGVEYIELPVALDAVAVVVNRANGWADDIRLDELRRLWEPQAQGRVLRWSQLRAGWPEREIHLYGPGTDSGTYDAFTAAVVGRPHASRGDYTASEDDNVLAQGVAGDPLALGFFSLAYVRENREGLKPLAVAAGEDPGVLPAAETVASGAYRPLSRPIFVYVARSAASRPEVRAFVERYLEQAAALAPQFGYVPLPAALYAASRSRLDGAQVGSAFLAPADPARLTDGLYAAPAVGGAP